MAITSSRRRPGRITAALRGPNYSRGGRHQRLLGAPPIGEGGRIGHVRGQQPDRLLARKHPLIFWRRFWMSSASGGTLSESSTLDLTGAFRID